MDQNPTEKELLLLDRERFRKIAIDEVFKHDLGCTCDFCNLMHTRYAAAPIDSPEDFARAGGEHQDYPFQAEQTRHFASIANSLKIVAGAVVGLQSIFRGRDADNAVVQSPYRVLVDFIVGKPQATTGPSTQRAPAQQPAPTASAQSALVQQQLPTSAPTQPATQAANPYAKAKQVATNEEMARFKMDQKIRFDSKKWPGDSQKGRVILTNRAGTLVSEVDPQYLDIYADTIEFFADEAKKKVAAGTADERTKSDANFGTLNAAQYRRVAQDVRAGIIQRATVAPVQTYSGGGGDYE